MHFFDSRSADGDYMMLIVTMFWLKAVKFNDNYSAVVASSTATSYVGSCKQRIFGVIIGFILFTIFLCSMFMWEKDIPDVSIASEYNRDCISTVLCR